TPTVAKVVVFHTEQIIVPGAAVKPVIAFSTRENIAVAFGRALRLAAQKVVAVKAIKNIGNVFRVRMHSVPGTGHFITEIRTAKLKRQRLLILIGIKFAVGQVTGIKGSIVNNGALAGIGPAYDCRAA